MFFLPGRPESTDFLTHAEQKLAIERMNRGTTGDIGAVVNQSTYLGPSRHFKQLIWISGHVIAAFLDWRASLSLSCTSMPWLISVLGIRRWRHVLWVKLCTRFFVGFFTHDHWDDGALYVRPEISQRKRLTNCAISSACTIAAHDCSSLCGSRCDPDDCVVYFG